LSCCLWGNLVNLLIVPASSWVAVENLELTVRRLWSVDDLKRRFPQLDSRVEKELNNCGRFAIWGATNSGNNFVMWRRLKKGDIVVFYCRGYIVFWGRVVGKVRSVELAKKLWFVQFDDKVWGLIYFIGDVREVRVPIDEFNRILGYSSHFVPRGHTLLLSSKVYRVIDEVVALLNKHDVNIGGFPVGRSLCESFIEQAVKTWHWIRVGKLTGINISEESITDFNLLELQVKHPYEIVTWKFTRWKESIVGADWEWWLGSGGYWLGLRVQAKKIEPEKLEYPTLDKENKSLKRNKPVKQINLLIRNAFNNQPPMVPVYVFYNYWDVNKFDPPWLCIDYPKLVEMLGCAVSNAFAVKAILDKGSKKLEDIAKISYPWSCLVCCKRFSRQNLKLPFRALEFLFGAFRRYIGDKYFSPDIRDSFITQEVPAYVHKILNRVKLTEKDLEKIKVNRVTVIYEGFS